MRISAAKKVLVNAITRAKPIVLVSGPGIGKTSLVTQVTNELGRKLHISYPVLWDITDPKGLPMPCPSNSGKAIFLPFGEVYAMLNATEPTVWFFDDAGQANEDVQAALMPVFLSRVIAGQKLPDCVALVMATNGVEHAAHVNPMLAPLKTRMAGFINVEHHIEDYTDWALVNGIEPTLIAFLRYKPAYLYQFEDTAEMRAFACPRVWTEVDEWEKGQADESLKLSPAELLEVQSSLVGDAIATEYQSFKENYKSMTFVDKVLHAPESAPIPKKADQLFSLTTALAHMVNDLTFANVLKYAVRLADEHRADMGHYMVQLSVRRQPKLKETRAYVDYVTSKNVQEMMVV